MFSDAWIDYTGFLSMFWNSVHMANSDIVSICVDQISRIYCLCFLSFWLYMFYISVLVLIALFVYRFVDHCSQNKESCHLPKMFSQPIWNPDTSQGFASIMTCFSFSCLSFSCFFFSWFSFFRFSLSCFYSVSMFMFFFLYHLSLLLPRSYFLSIGSPIHLCFIFLPVTVPYNPTALQAHAAPVLSLCFPAFRSCCLTRSFSYLPAFLSVLRAFALLSSLLPHQTLPGYKKIPSRGLWSGPRQVDTEK